MAGASEEFRGIVCVSRVTYSIFWPEFPTWIPLHYMHPAPDVLCAGIIVADHVCTPISHLPGPGELAMAERMLLTLGGCAANTAVDLAKMGVRSAVAGRVGADLFGRIVGDMLKEAKVETSALKAVGDQDTSQTLIVNVAGQDRRYIHTFGANSGFRAADIDPTGCKVLYVGGFLLMQKLTGSELAGLFRDARASGTQTFLDVVTPPGVDYLAELKTVLPQTDVFKPNADEARLITGERDTRKQARIFRDLGVQTVIISGGHDGSLLMNDEGTFRAGIYPIEFVDGSGGGDAFDAGFIYGMLNRMGTEDCLRYGSALGASCVRAIGTTPGVFTRPECEAFMKQNALRIERA
jgi:sugar/nucleoside kinase (ribokinase family)